jgi:hypothetical protein
MELSSGMSWLCVSRERTSLPFCSPFALKEICFVYFLGRLECVSPPLRMSAISDFFEGCLDLDPECRRSKLARYQLIL